MIGPLGPACIEEASAIAVLLVVLSATILPLLVLPTLPLVDWPNHLARLHALGAGPGDPIRQAYGPHWALMPDLGCDLIYLALKTTMSPETVLRLCLCGSVLTICLAAWRIQHLLLGTTSYAVSITPLVATGLSVGMGYLNFLIGVSVALVGFAAYLAWRSRLSATRLAILSVLATISWVAHFAGYSVLAFLLGVTLLWGPPCHGDSGATRRPALRAGGLYLAVIGPGILLSLLAEKQDSAPWASYGEQLQKLRFLLAPFLATADVANMGVVLLFAAIVLLVCRLGSFDFSTITMPAILLLGCVIVALPWQLGDAIDVDARLMLPFSVLVLASTRIRLPQRLLPHAACIVLILAMLAVHLQVLQRAAQMTGGEVAAFRKVAARLPEGAALMVARDADPASTCHPPARTTLPLLHLAAYAAIDRGAYVPAIFTASGMQPLRAARPPFDASARPIMPPSFELLGAIAQAGGSRYLSSLPSGSDAFERERLAMIRSRNTAFLDHWPASYDALLVLHDGCPRNIMPTRLSRLGGDDLFTLYRVVHGGK